MDEAMVTTQIMDWYKCFKGGCSFRGSETRSVRPTKSTNDLSVKTLAIMKSRIRIRELSHEMNIAIGFIISILTEHVAIMRIPAIFILKLLTIGSEFLDQTSKTHLCFFNLLTLLTQNYLTSGFSLQVENGTRFQSREDIIQNATSVEELLGEVCRKSRRVF